MSGLKDWFEDLLDNNLPGGKKTRKVLEQIVGHFMLVGGLSGAVGALLVFGVEKIDDNTNDLITIPGSVYLVASLITSFAGGTIREYLQNIGDEPNEKTLFTIPIGDGLPVNADLMIDWVVTGFGGLIPGVIFMVII